MDFLSIPKKFSDLHRAKNVILKIPYESAISYGGGCHLGPDAIVKASGYVELFDEEFNIKPHTSGISTESFSVFTEDHEQNLKKIGKEFVKYTQMGKFVIALGGEHSITIGIIQGLTKLYKNLSVIQFDAHADLRNYFQKSYYNHACTMRRVYEIVPRISSVGVRSFSESEFNFMRKKEINPISSRDVQNLPTAYILERMLDSIGDDVYITFDIDYFSLALVRDTGTPEPGGPGWYKTLDILRSIFEHRNVVGMDVVELVGGKVNGSSDVSAFTTASLVKKCVVYKLVSTK